MRAGASATAEPVKSKDVGERKRMAASDFAPYNSSRGSRGDGGVRGRGGQGGGLETEERVASAAAGDTVVSAAAGDRERERDRETGTERERERE